MLHFLDNGCGPGRHAMFFARQGFHVTALDQSREALDYLKNWAEAEQVPVEALSAEISSGCPSRMRALTASWIIMYPITPILRDTAVQWKNSGGASPRG